MLQKAPLSDFFLLLWRTVKEKLNNAANFSKASLSTEIERNICTVKHMKVFFFSLKNIEKKSGLKKIQPDRKRELKSDYVVPVATDYHYYNFY